MENTKYKQDEYTTVPTKYNTVFVYIHNENFNFKIVETLPTGKTKVRRRVIGRLYKKPNKNGKQVKVHDQFGNSLYVPFHSFDDAKTNALNFVDNFLKLTT